MVKLSKNASEDKENENWIYRKKIEGKVQRKSEREEHNLTAMYHLVQNEECVLLFVRRFVQRNAHAHVDSVVYTYQKLSEKRRNKLNLQWWPRLSHMLFVHFKPI